MLPKLRTLNRLRWIQKARIVASHGEAPLRHLRYVLVDYLFEAFCYPVENQEDLARWLAGAFSREQSEVRALLSELEGDVALQELLRSRLRLPGDRRPVDFGYRLPWYLIARLAKPRLIVETGIQSGLGSMLILRALQRNAAEGAPGELVSVDVAPNAGWLAQGSASSPWRRLTGPSDPTLGEALAGRRVGMLVHDSPHIEEIQRAEFDFALEHADEELVLVDASGGETPVLSQLCQRIGVPRHFFREKPASGFYAGPGVACAIVSRQTTPRERPPSRDGRSELRD